MRVVLDPDFRGFQWDEAKAAANEVKHGITFLEAAEALAHPHMEIESDRDGEKRVLAICPLSEQVIAVVYTMRHEKCRIISARAARRNEQRAYRLVFSQ